jgi:hypothetical protein
MGLSGCLAIVPLCIEDKPAEVMAHIDTSRFVEPATSDETVVRRIYCCSDLSRVVRNQIRDWCDDTRLAHGSCLLFDSELVDSLVRGCTARSERVLNPVPIWPTKSPGTRCRMGLGWMPFESWCLAVNPSYTRLQSLFTIQGFMRAMLSSRFFGMPFLPNCPVLMHSVYASILCSYEPFALPKAC